MADARLKRFGQQIRRLRKERGLSQEALAARANLDRSYMGHIERGENNVTFEKICQIADALEVDPRELFA
jgi:transcriptional regulator with XRE-family HTH domain